MSTTFIFKAVFALIVSTLLAGCGAFAAPTLADSAPAPEQALASRIDQSVVLVKGYEKTTFDDGEAVFHDTYGTGIVVAPRVVALNAHTVGKTQADLGKRFMVLLANGDKVIATVLACDFDHDVALVRPESADVTFDAPAVTLAKREPTIGEAVRILARLSGFQISNVSDVTPVYGNVRYIATDFTTRKGDSGSPLYNAQGEVIGIHAIGKGLGGKNTYAVPSTDIVNLMASAQK